MSTKKCVNCGETKQQILFSKHSGTKDKLDNRCKACVKLVKKNRIENNIDSKEYPIYNLDLDYDDWQCGKPTGSILHRIDPTYSTERYEVRIPLGGSKCKSKSFSFNNYDSSDIAKDEAQKWLVNYSKENNLTKNMIKIKDPSTIMIKLTQDMIMTTDIGLSDTCQKYMICSTKSGNETAEYYASLTINNKLHYFHKHITGNPMTDHINRDPMDNRMVNLRKTTPKLNNNNRSSPKKCKEYEFHELGVRYLHRDEAWQARIKQNGKEYTKSFSIKKYGYEESKHMAMDARKEFNIQFSCTNTIV